MARALPAARVGTVGERRPGPASQRTLTARNRQRLRRVDLPLLRRIVQALLHEIWPDRPFDLGLHLVAEAEMTRLNETFLRHKGSTDVIAFDYTESAGQAPRLPGFPAPHTPSPDRQEACPALLHGEIFICIDEAVAQARRFRTSWQSELIRYVIHGLLHLRGYDDQHAPARRQMKREEDRLLRRLAPRFN